jgi:hypothetical protein
MERTSASGKSDPEPTRILSALQIVSRNRRREMQQECSLPPTSPTPTAATVIPSNVTIGLQTIVNGSFVSAENAGNSPLIANRPGIGTWEQFQWIVGSDGTVALKALVNGRFVCAENAGNNPLIANRAAAPAGGWERFY